MRQRARERIQENTAMRERLEEGSSILERRKAILKRYGFTLTAIALVLGTTIGVMVSELSKGLNSVANWCGKWTQRSREKVSLPATRSPWLYCEFRVPQGGRECEVPRQKCVIALCSCCVPDRTSQGSTMTANSMGDRKDC